MLNTLSAEEVESGSVPVLSKAQSEERRRMNEWLVDKIAQGKKKPFAEIITLTPVLASLLLERNPINRPINKRNQQELAQDVANGRFVFNGEPIIISDTGYMNDGQHRAQTVVDTKTAILTVIVFGPKEDTRFTVDSGKSKTVSNYLAMKGRNYTHVIGATVGYYLLWQKNGTISHSAVQPTKQEKLAAAEELRGIDKSVEFTVPAMKTTRAHAVVALCHYIFTKKAGRVEADAFIGRLMDGEGLRKGSPILYCRNRLIGMGRGPYANTRAELIFKCWNAWRLGGQVDHCKLTGHLPKVER